MRMLRLLAASLLVTSCASEAAPDDEIDMPSFDDFADGKADTGYFGSRSAEMEATLTGSVRVSLPGKSQTELAAIAEALRTNPQDFAQREIVYQVTQQAKFARNALRAAKFTLNLEGGDPTFTAITVEATGLKLDYQLKIESLVKYKELEAMGLKPADLVGQAIDLELPANLDGLLERASTRCASDFDANGAAVPAADLRADNMFYYWDPARSGCTLGASELAAGRYTVTSSNATTEIYPEYDQLAADGKITMVQIFGQIEHGELSSSDWGFISYNDITRILKNQGFKVAKKFPNNAGQQLKKTMPNGLVVEMDMLTPVQFADHVDRDLANAAFRDAIRSHEIVYYAGHAFYGSLTVLDEPTAYPANQYQIIFMDACWSYAYYTKQIFKNKATAADPTGWMLTDVVNNTEMGITGSEQTAAVLWENVFKGADAVYKNRSARRYSWSKLVQYMNEHAQRRADARGENNPEIYGVSGVRTNVFKP
jgi:hypothetical protein